MPPGSVVTFRARGADGTIVISGGYLWPDATPVEEDGEFQATFSNVRGNEWWVEADVGANEPLAGVDARVNGGAWRPLSQTAWGSWADSFFVPEGSTVELRARSVDGDVDVSAPYPWPP